MTKLHRSLKMFRRRKKTFFPPFPKSLRRTNHTMICCRMKTYARDVLPAAGKIDGNDLLLMK